MWYLGSVATQSMIFDEDWFITYQPLLSLQNLFMGDNDF
jgi:hypothetical protein